MQVELIRHGCTDWQAEKRYVGRSDRPLSPEGRLALREDIRPVKRVFVSPLLRARQTAEILFPRAEIIPVPGLAEMDFGLFEGRNAQEMEEDPLYRAWVEGGCRGRCPGGESRQEFCRRVNAAFFSLLEEALSSGEQEIVIVAHGGTQMAVGERFVRPEKPYFSWQTPCGCGLLFHAGEWMKGKTLRFLRETDYRKAEER